MATIQIPGNAGSFLTYCIGLYGQLLEDSKLCRRKGLEKLEEIQCCFEIAMNYTVKLAAEVSAYQFATLADEIVFFKKIKPLFTGEAEFCTYRYHAEIFKDTVEDNCPLELELFYRRQLQRRQKFGREHAAFYRYMQEGRQDLDADWFTRPPEEPAACLYDKPLASLQAIGQYEQFVEEALKAIGVVIEMPLKEENNP